MLSSVTSLKWRNFFIIDDRIRSHFQNQFKFAQIFLRNDKYLQNKWHIFKTKAWSYKSVQKFFCFLSLQKNFLFFPKKTGFQIFWTHCPINNIWTEKFSVKNSWVFFSGQFFIVVLSYYCTKYSFDPRTILLKTLRIL